MGNSNDGSAVTALAGKLIRNFRQAELQHRVREPLYDSHSVRLARGTAAQGLGLSVVTVAPGKRASPYHLHHAEEEMFIIVSGSGTLRVAGEMLPLVEGDVVFIPPGPEYPHQIINTSDQPLAYLAISNRCKVEVCEYPDSDKFQADVSTDAGTSFEATRRRGDELDYWDGEP